MHNYMSPNVWYQPMKRATLYKLKRSLVCFIQLWAELGLLKNKLSLLSRFLFLSFFLSFFLSILFFPLMLSFLFWSLFISIWEGHLEVVELIHWGLFHCQPQKPFSDPMLCGLPNGSAWTRPLQNTKWIKFRHVN